eukprot:NODE_903_length_3183_cov_0.453632.p2 type:complete len:217 gc:universal NODE_903_length_3183_cov_0.453632:1479-2129(+)
MDVINWTMSMSLDSIQLLKLPTLPIFLMLLTLLLNFSVSIDCPIVLKLATQMHFKQKFPTTYQQLEKDCCLDSGIVCQDGRVTQMRWTDSTGYYSPEPTIKEPNTTIYSFPSSLEVLDMDQFFGGTINELPVNMTYLRLVTSYVTLNVSAMSQKLTYAYLDFVNCIQDAIWGDSLSTVDIESSNMIDFPKLPASVKDLKMWRNRFTKKTSKYLIGL